MATKQQKEVNGLVNENFNPQNIESKVGFLGFGSYFPERVLTNEELVKAGVDTSDEWITSRTGIKQRRIVKKNESTSDIGFRAALKALEDSQVLPEEIELIIATSSSPDGILQSTACKIQAILGISGIPAFDVPAACSGFTYAVGVASAMMKEFGYRKVLVVAAESFSKIVDWKDRNTCILFGDGAAAAVLALCEPGYGILDTVLGADGSGWEKICVPAGGSYLPASAETLENGQHFVKMNGRGF